MADVDGDGVTDLVLASGNLDQVTLVTTYEIATLRGDGHGAFLPFASTKLDEACVGLALGDLDGDGILDAAAVSDSASKVFVALGNGFGFGAPSGFAVLDQPLSLVIADVDCDGGADLVVSCPVIDGLVILAHNPNNTAGAAPFGAATPGCSGAPALTTNGPFQLGNSAFRLIATNAPPLSLGLGVLANIPDLAGNTTLIPGVGLHLDLLASTWVVPLDFHSDAAGIASFPLPIPTNPSFVGFAAYAQIYWQWPQTAPCDPSFFGLGASRGLAMIVFP